MELLGYMAMLLVGATLGLIGGGGAILTVPVMVFLFGVPPVLATTYSLFVVGVSSLFGVWRYHQEKLVDYKTALNFALPSFLGTYLARRILLPSLPAEIFQLDGKSFTKDQLVMVVFALVMVLASWSMIRDGKSHRPGSDQRRSYWLLWILGLGVGSVAGFVGAGGGFLIIPALVTIAGIPMRTAIGTSLLIISANSLFGFAGDALAAHQMNWQFLSLTTAIAFVGIFFGSLVSGYISASKLKPAFGWFVLLMGLFIIYSQL